MATRQNPILRYTESLFSKPHLISAESFKVIQTYLEDRNAGKLMKIDESPVDTNEDDDDPGNDDGFGVIDIKGSLTNEPLVTMCGEVGTSYESIIDQAGELLDAGVTTLILNIDSGGGEAFNCFQAANLVRQMADDAGTEIYAYVGSCAASAAYAWACMADEVIAHPDSTTGSIGVLIALQNNSEQMKKEGITRSFVTAGKDKVPFAADGSFTEQFIEDLQYKVDALYENFVAHVSTYTGLSDKEIKDTEAKTYMAADALKLGLINSIMTESEFTSYIVNKQKGHPMLKNLRKELDKIFTEKDTKMAVQDKQAVLSVETLTAELTTAHAALVEKAAELEGVQGTLAELQNKFDSLNAELASVQEHRDAVLAKAKEQKDAARMSVLKVTVGDTQAPIVFAATAALDETQFQAVVTAMAGSVGEEGKTQFFKEVGVSADADVSKVTTELGESEEMKIIKAKFGPQKQ